MSNWVRIEEFPNYIISDFGEIVNEITGRVLNKTMTLQGALKVDLIKDGIKYTRSLKVLVAEGFVEGESELFNTPIQLDGNQKNCKASNLMWRPRWFAWKYSRQFSELSEHYKKGPIRDVDTRDRYFDVYEAGIVNGILFKDIWRSIHFKNPEVRTDITHQRFELIR